MGKDAIDEIVLNKKTYLNRSVFLIKINSNLTGFTIMVNEI